MTLETTLILMAAAVAVLVLAIVAERRGRGYAPGRPPLVPYPLVQFLAVLAILMLAGHVISLLTGEPYRGRLG